MAEATPPTHNKLSLQLKKLTEANAKYKSLLKLAKERIQHHEEEAVEWKTEKATLEDTIESLAAAASSAETTPHNNNSSTPPPPHDAVTNIVRVARRIRNTPLQGGDEEIWALLDMEQVSEEFPQTNKRYQEWVRFATESNVEDYIRRDTGEPLTVPPFSLSPEQATAIQQQAQETVANITQEFQRFRVRSELARNQAEEQMRELQSSAAQAQRLEGRDTRMELEQARSATQQLERMKGEMAAQEAHWKEAYDALAAENTALKSSGSEAMLASQWRQRYEVCTKEKQALEERFKSMNHSEISNGDKEKYEQKYRDLKESFRLYRKKAKEIFEAQQLGEGGRLSSAAAMNITSNSSADAKLSYLKNLMINYLTADPTVRDHMEGAIGTVLQFSPEDRQKLESRKAASDSWF